MWYFKSSYKNMFWYVKDGVTVCIMGDIYRDTFEATMSDKSMEYFKNLENVEVIVVRSME